MGVVHQDDGWRLPDELWAKMQPLLPPRPPHPLGCHNPRVPDRQAMDAILLVLRTALPWDALKATDICHPSSAYRRFREWLAAGVFREFWRQGLHAYAALVGIDLEWLALDGAMAKAPLGGEKTGPNPTDRGKKGSKKSLLTDGRGAPLGLRVAGANVNDHKLMHSTLQSLPVERPSPTEHAPQGLCLDKGYDYDRVRALAVQYGFTLHLRRRGEPDQPLESGKKARRWVVERTHGWLQQVSPSAGALGEA
ncbi:transposase [Melittangium boletus DSM 14713]|uniref:Transposase n=1 Tax=Melittangium boletus DSM 14713 TaxID=1294270 RepID=A0A250IKL3_9BACT|nr:transposase [Melittangium boletus DSM 14713]